MKTYRIKEIFGPTLSGEGSQVGAVVLFLRFAGCNKWTGLEKDRAKSVCKFCDTDFRGGSAMTASEIVVALRQQSEGVNNLVISGGEATLQLDAEILTALRQAGFYLMLETNGSRALGDLHGFFDHITMSPKQGVAETKLESCDDLKILYPPPLHDVTLEAFSAYPAKTRFLQAVWDNDYAANLKATICRLYGNPTWRLSLQTHKITGVQ